MTLVREIILSDIRESAPVVIDIGSRYTKLVSKVLFLFRNLKID